MKWDRHLPLRLMRELNGLVSVFMQGTLAKRSTNAGYYHSCYSPPNSLLPLGFRDYRYLVAVYIQTASIWGKLSRNTVPLAGVLLNMT